MHNSNIAILALFALLFVSANAQVGVNCMAINCTCLNMAVITNPGINGKEIQYVNEANSGQAYASYLACGMDFSAFLTYRWQIFRGSVEVPLGSIRSDTSVITAPPNFFLPDVQYTTRLTISGYHNDSYVWSGNFSMRAPLAVVRLGGLSSMVRTGPSNIQIPASITAPQGAPAMNATWSCRMKSNSSMMCPASITDALATATNMGVTIPGPVAAGQYVLNMTYGMQTTLLVLDVRAEATPLVFIHPYSPQTNSYFLMYRAVLGNSSMTGTMEWLLNGVSVSTKMWVELPVSQLVAGADNNITLRANTTAGMGEAVVVVKTAPVPEVTITGVSNGDGSQNAADPLWGRIRVNFTGDNRNFDNRGYKITVAYMDHRYEGPQEVRLPSAKCEGSVCVFQAPVPSRAEGNTVNVSFKLLVLRPADQSVAFWAPFWFNVRNGSAELPATVGALLHAATDKAYALGLAVQSVSVFKDEAPATVDAARKLLQLIGNEMLTVEETTQVLLSLRILLTQSTAMDVLNLMNTQMTFRPPHVEFVTLYLSHARASHNLRGPAVVGALNRAAAALSESLPVGTDRKVGGTGYGMLATRLIMAPGPMTIRGDLSNLTIPVDSLMGVQAGDVFAIVGSEFGDDVFSSNVTLGSRVVSYSFAMSGEVKPIMGANPPLVIEMPTNNATAVCRYFNITTRRWEQEGVMKLTTAPDAPTVRCSATLLGSLAAISSFPVVPPPPPPMSPPPVSPPPANNTNTSVPPPPSPPPSQQPESPFCRTVNCTCLNMAVISNVEVKGKEINYVHETISGMVQVQYRACDTIFNPFLSYRWQLYRGESEVMLGAIRANTSVLTIPPFFFVPDVPYKVRVTIFGYHNDSYVWNGDFTVRAPAPVVRLGGISSMVRTGPTNIRIPASVSLAYGNITMNATWSCKVDGNATAMCPASITDALANATNMGVTIPGPVAPGRYVLNMTYNGVWSPLVLEVVAGAVPKINVEALTTALAEPMKFAYSPRLSLAFRARVESTDMITGLVWKLNGATLAFTGQVVDLNMTRFVAGAINNLTVRANTAAGAYGESTVEVQVAAVPTLTITGVENADKPGTTSAQALKDRIRANVTASTTSIFGVALTYTVSYDDVRNGKIQRVRLPAPQSGTDNVLFVAPMPTTTGDEASVTFFLELNLGNQLMVSASSSFAVRPGSRATATASQAAQLGVTSDRTEVVSIASNMGSMLNNATLRAEYASTVVNALKSSAKEGGTFTEAQSSQVVNSLNTMVTANTAKDVLSVMLSLNVPAESAAAALDVIQTVLQNGGRGAGAVQATERVANAVLESTPIGESKTVSSGTVTIVTTRLVISNTSATVRGESSSVTLPPGGIPGLRDGDVGGIVGSEFQSNPSGSNITTASKVVSFSIVVNGSVLSVTGLNPPLYIVIDSANPSTDVCRYLTPNETWSAAGVAKVGYSATKINCSTTHLTSFAGLSGSSSSAATFVSALAIVLATMIQLLQ